MVHNKLEKDGGRKIIYTLVCDKDEDGKDMKGWGAVIKDGGRRLVTEGGSIEGVGRVFQKAVELRMKQR